MRNLVTASPELSSPFLWGLSTQQLRSEFWGRAESPPRVASLFYSYFPLCLPYFVLYPTTLYIYLYFTPLPTSSFPLPLFRVRQNKLLSSSNPSHLRKAELFSSPLLKQLNNPNLFRSVLLTV